MKYIAFPIEEIDAVMEICVGEVNRYSDFIMNEDEDKNCIMNHIIKAKWEGKVEALGEMMKFGKEINIE